MIDSETFMPPRLLRNRYVQTILASSRIRAWGQNEMAEAGRNIIWETENGAKLLGVYSPQANAKPKAVVILLHGWEGSSDSTYMLCTGRFLYRHGYAIVRINFRDHGDTHHLNEGLFYATLLDEVFESVAHAAQLEPNVPAFLVGFSMGGNFALRIARKHSSRPIKNLRHVAAISPGLNPTTSTDAIDNDWLLQRYFLKKWRRSLRIKEALYPQRYDFTEMWPLTTVRDMTDWLVEHYSEYETTDDYFKRYELAGNALKEIGVPTTMIVSEDDPIINSKDFHGLDLNSMTDMIIHRYGGHNGFILRFPSISWYEEKLLNLYATKL